MVAPGRVLIVDDEPALLSVMSMYVSRLGYEVETSADADEACWKVASAPKRYVLVLADLSMMGAETAATMLETDPDLRMVITSGYPFDPSRLGPSLARRAAFLHKPFNAEMLQETMQSLLSRTVSPPPETSGGQAR